MDNLVDKEHTEEEKNDKASKCSSDDQSVLPKKCMGCKGKGVLNNKWFSKREGCFLCKEKCYVKDDQFQCKRCCGDGHVMNSSVLLPKKCIVCKGIGYVSDRQYDCMSCDATGISKYNGSGLALISSYCCTCNGIGYVSGPQSICVLCQGEGTSKDSKKWMSNIISSSCPACQGKKYVINQQFECLKCLGDGNVAEGGECRACLGKCIVPFDQEQCGSCNGRGRVKSTSGSKKTIDCTSCEGAGYISLLPLSDTIPLATDVAEVNVTSPSTTTVATTDTPLCGDTSRSSAGGVIVGGGDRANTITPLSYKVPSGSTMSNFRSNKDVMFEHKEESLSLCESKLKLNGECMPKKRLYSYVAQGSKHSMDTPSKRMHCGPPAGAKAVAIEPCFHCDGLGAIISPRVEKKDIWRSSSSSSSNSNPHHLRKYSSSSPVEKKENHELHIVAAPAPSFDSTTTTTNTTNTAVAIDDSKATEITTTTTSATTSVKTPATQIAEDNGHEATAPEVGSGVRNRISSYSRKSNGRLCRLTEVERSTSSTSTSKFSSPHASTSSSTRYNLISPHSRTLSEAPRRGRARYYSYSTSDNASTSAGTTTTTRSSSNPPPTTSLKKE